MPWLRSQHPRYRQRYTPRRPRMAVARVRGGDGAKVAAVAAATNSDLSAFRARGGKLLLARLVRPDAQCALHDRVFRGGAAAHAAGLVVHAALPDAGRAALRGRERPRDVDHAGVIRRWVEQGEAPSRIIARKLRGTQVVRTHPLCGYPMTARYNGTGSTDDAAAFTCR